MSDRHDLQTLVLSQRQAGVVQLTMNRPAVFNAFDEVMIGELDAMFEQLIADPAVRVIVLAGAGKHFSAGMALDVFGNENFSILKTDDARRRLAFQDSLRQLMRCFDVLEEARFPVIAAVKPAPSLPNNSATSPVRSASKTAVPSFTLVARMRPAYPAASV